MARRKISSNTFSAALRVASLVITMPLLISYCQAHVPSNRSNLPEIAVSIEQTSTRPTINVTVTNHNTRPFTILDWSPPFSIQPVSLGLIYVIPGGASESLFPQELFIEYGYPDSPEGLITISPGQSTEKEIVIEHPQVHLPDEFRTENTDA